jgi:hypothetical protein
MDRYDTISKLEEVILGRSSPKTTTWLERLPGLPIASAQGTAEDTPAWVRNKPRDTPASRFFVGLAEAADLTAAREASVRNAHDQALRELVRGVAKGATSIDAREELRLRDFVKKLADVSETTFVFDKGRSRFKYWTLLRLNPRAFDATVAAGGAEVKRPPSARILHSVEPQYFNSDRTLRLEYANVLIERTGKATLSFQAAATIRVRFPPRTGPAVALMFLDRNRKPLGVFREVAYAVVNICGGYENHETEVNDKGFSWSVLDMATTFALQVQPDAPGTLCDRRGVPPPF